MTYEYANVVNGRVVNITMTSQPKESSELIKYSFGCTGLVPIWAVPDNALEAYQYWNERP